MKIRDRLKAITEVLPFALAQWVAIGVIFTAGYQVGRTGLGEYLAMFWVLAAILAFAVIALATALLLNYQARRLDQAKDEP